MKRDIFLQSRKSAVEIFSHLNVITQEHIDPEPDEEFDSPSYKIKISQGLFSVPTTAFSSRIGSKSQKKGFKVIKNNMLDSSKKHMKGLDSIVTVQEISKANQSSKMVILK